MEKVEKIRLDIPDEKVKEDLEKYCLLAKELGASDTKYIKTNQITIDERVVLKCIIPKCFGYGVCANCPPHSLKPEETQKYIAQYKWAVIFKYEIPPEVIVRNKETIKERAGAYHKTFEMVNKIESAAFYDGYYLSVGFGAGSCKSTFCWKDDCAVLQGNKCRFSLRARPSMEAVGIDCYKLAVELGWDIYPIGSDAKPESIPHGTLMGLVLIT
ncbi:MAG: DUF2284 domain-containing protein [Candidatus Hodarchaeales archaeon]|jgi:predicted metal-binding protein